MSIREIGCCGAYCKTCLKSSSGSNCLGCKLGYKSGERDIAKAKCRIKLCCFRYRGLETCSDCQDYPNCNIILSFHEKSRYKYKKYRQSIEFIIGKGYGEFLEIADNWTGPYGRLL